MATVTPIPSPESGQNSTPISDSLRSVNITGLGFDHDNLACAIRRLQQNKNEVHVQIRTYNATKNETTNSKYKLMIVKGNSLFSQGNLREYKRIQVDGTIYALLH